MLVIAVVLLAVTLVHLDRFDLDGLFGVFWLCAYIAAPPLLAYGIFLERRAGLGRRSRPAAAGGPARGHRWRRAS